MGEVIGLASFSQIVKCKYGIETYQDTKNTYDWMLKSLYKMNQTPKNVSSDFSFYTGDISCSCKTIEEFVENAYGAQMYSLSTMSILAFDLNVYLAVDSRNVVTARANSKKDLEEIVGLLDITELGPEEINDPISVTYIERQDNSVTITGNRNIVANNHSTIVDEQEKAESKTSKWLQGICQGVLANGVWKLLGILAAIIIAYTIGKSI